MLKHGQMVPMISSSLGYRNGSIFHHQWLYDAKNPFVYAWQTAFHMWKIGVQRFSASVHMEPNSLAFESFPMISNDMKLFVETPNVSASSFCVWHESSSNNASNSASSYTFGLPLRSLSSMSNSQFLNFWTIHDNFSHLRQHHMLLQAIYFKEINQKFPQMLIRLKTRHFRTKKNIWCWYKIANISRLWCCRISNLTIYRFTSNNFNYSLLMAPSFANGGNLFVLPIKSACISAASVWSSYAWMFDSWLSNSSSKTGISSTLHLKIEIEDRNLTNEDKGILIPIVLTRQILIFHSSISMCSISLILV